MKGNYTGENLGVGLLGSIVEEVTCQLRPEGWRTSQQKNGVECVWGRWVGDLVFQAQGEKDFAVSQYPKQGCLPEKSPSQLYILALQQSSAYLLEDLGSSYAMKCWNGPALLKRHPPVTCSSTAWSLTSLFLLVMTCDGGAFLHNRCACHLQKVALRTILVSRREDISPSLTSAAQWNNSFSGCELSPVSVSRGFGMEFGSHKKKKSVD